MSGWMEHLNQKVEAHRWRKEHIELPIRHGLEAEGYGFASFCAEMESHEWVVALSSDCLRVFTAPPAPAQTPHAAPQEQQGARLIAQWLDHGLTPDQYAVCLRAEMEATWLIAPSHLANVLAAAEEAVMATGGQAVQDALARLAVCLDAGETT